MRAKRWGQSVPPQPAYIVQPRKTAHSYFMDNLKLIVLFLILATILEIVQ